MGTVGKSSGNDDQQCTTDASGYHRRLDFQALVVSRYISFLYIALQLPQARTTTQAEPFLTASWNRRTIGTIPPSSTTKPRPSG